MPVDRYVPSKGTHRKLAERSVECHRAATEGDVTNLLDLERKVDTLVAKLWGIADDDLKAIQEALAETGKSGRSERESTDSADDTDR